MSAIIFNKPIKAWLINPKIIAKKVTTFLSRPIEMPIKIKMAINNQIIKIFLKEKRNSQISVKIK